MLGLITDIASSIMKKINLKKNFTKFQNNGRQLMKLFCLG